MVHDDFSKSSFVNKEVEQSAVEQKYLDLQQSIKYKEPKLIGLTPEQVVSKKAKALSDFYNSFFDLEIERLQETNQFNASKIDKISSDFIDFINKKGIRHKLGL